jgi:DNA-binding LacI/PurR family transcriptional regulator
MAANRVRMIDVARAAGVSRTTASFVLNGREASIPEETRERVRVAAAEMGYRPHSTALALATGRTHRIGIILNEPASFRNEDRYFTGILRGITDGALCHNYNLLLHSARYADWRDLHDDLLSGASDGSLLVGRYMNDELTPALLEVGHPCVCISYHIEHPRCCAVDCDNEQGAYMAIRHLLDLGHRQIALLHPGDEVSWGRERRLGAMRAITEAGLSQDCLYVYSWQETSRPSFEWVDAARDALAKRVPRVTAVLCCEEARAVRLAEAMPESGLKVPEDIAVISFNSTDLSARARPPLTSVWQPLEEIGEAAVGMLVDLIEQRTPVNPVRRFPMRLDVRQSCGSRQHPDAGIGI